MKRRSKYGAKKTCSVCGLSEGQTDFYDLKSLSRCKKCNAAYAAEWKQKNPDKAKRIDKKSKQLNKEAIRERKRKARVAGLYRENRELSKVRRREYLARLKDAAYEAYGGYKCACCGETEKIFLCLDHVNNDGSAHRRKIRGSLYAWLRKNNYPSGLLQPLCFNCNFAKQFGPCPHQKEAA